MDAVRADSQFAALPRHDGFEAEVVVPAHRRRLGVHDPRLGGGVLEPHVRGGLGRGADGQHHVRLHLHKGRAVRRREQEIGLRCPAGRGGGRSVCRRRGEHVHAALQHSDHAGGVCRRRDGFQKAERGERLGFALGFEEHVRDGPSASDAGHGLCGRHQQLRRVGDEDLVRRVRRRLGHLLQTLHHGRHAARAAAQQLGDHHRVVHRRRSVGRVQQHRIRIDHGRAGASPGADDNALRLRGSHHRRRRVGRLPAHHDHVRCRAGRRGEGYALTNFAVVAHDWFTPMKRGIPSFCASGTGV